MKQSQDQIQTLQVLYELAMSIGTSLDLHPMLEVSLQAFIKELDCAAGGVYQHQVDGASFQFEAVHTIPQHTDRNGQFNEALTYLPGRMDAARMEQFLETLPLVQENEDGQYYHLLELPDFGVMVLVREHAALDPFWVEALRPLQEKLAAAALACSSETALHKAQEHSQVILESVTTPLLISRLSDGKIIYANQLLADMIRSPLEDLIGEVTPDFYADPSDRQVLLNNLRQQGSLSNYELHLKRNDGELIWVLISIRIFDYQGEPALITSFFDITDRKQTMQALEESQSRNQLILESVTLPLLISRVEDGTVVFANERIVEMMDMQLEDVLGKQTPDFYYNPDDRRDVLKGIQEHGGIDNKELPIMRKGEILWVLLSNRLVKYEGDDAIITTLVDITDRKNAEEALAKRAAELETVAQVSASASTILETERLLQEVVDLTKERFNLYHAHIYLLDEVNSNLVLTAGAGDVGRQMVAEKRTIPLTKEQSLVAQAARTKLGIIENDVLNNPAFLPHPLLPDTKAEMAVPMLVGERVVGVLDIQASETNYFTQQDVTVNTTLAAQIGIALENTASFEQAQTSLAETLALLDITRETSRTLELESMLDTVLDRVLAATNFSIGLISIEKPGTRELEIKRHRLPDEFLHLIRENGLGGTLCDLVYQREEPVIVLDLDDNPPINATALVNMGYQSYQGVPLEAQGKVFGTICIFNDVPLTSEKVNKRFLQAAGQQVGIAIQNAALFEQTQNAVFEAEQSRQAVQEYLDLQRVLHEINRELFLINDVDDLYRRAVELAHTRLGFERIGMYLLNETKDKLSGTYGINIEGNLRNEQDDEHVITASETIDSFVLNRNRLVIEEETDLWDAGSVLGRGWHIGAAMWVEESPIGAMFADNLITGKPLKPYQAELLFAYAGIVANLIERNRTDAIIAKQAAEMQAVAEVGTAVSQIRETEELLQAVVDLTKERFGLYHSHIYLLDAAENTLVMTVGAGDVGRELTAQGHRIDVDAPQSLVAQAARTKIAVVVNDVRSDPNWLPNVLLPDTQSEMAVPLVVGGQVIGVLDVQSNEIDNFTEQDIQIQTTLAAQTAVALQNARSYKQVQEALMETQRSQEAIQERETLLRTIIDSTPDWIFVKNREHRYQMVNQGYANSFNMPPEEFIGKNDLDLGFPEDIVKGNPEKGIQGFWPDDNEVMTSGEMKVVEVEPAVVGGEEVFLSTIKTPLRDAKGNVTGVVGFVHDITNRIAVEESLRRSEAELSQALEIAKLAYWEFDVANDLFTFNDQFYALFHTTAEQHGGYQLSSAYYAQHFVHPDDMAMVGSEIERALTSTDQHYIRLLEHRILYADGGVGHISVNVNVERDEEGNILRFYGANQDITVRKQVEESLRRSEAELSQAMDVAKLAYWEYEHENDLFIFNDQFYALFGTTAEAHGGYRLSSAYYAQHFVHPDDLHLVGSEIERSFNSTDRYYSRSLEHRILYADGSIGYIAVSVNIERDEDGKILRYYGANQDITARKRSEEVLRESEASLSEALKVAKLAYWEFDVENDLFVFNDQFFSLFHTTAEAHGGYQLTSNYYAEHFVYPEDLPIVGSEIERALTSTGRKFTTTFEHRILYADGSVGYISVNTNVDRDEQGKIVRFAGANQDITERKRAEEAIAKQAQELQIVAELSTTVATTLEQDRLLQEVVDLTKERFGFYHAQVYLLNAQQDKLVLVFGAGDVGRQLVAQKHQISLNASQSLVAQAAQSVKAIVVNDVRSDSNWLPNELLPGTQSEMAVPMIVGGQVIGVLDVQSDEMNHFTDQDVQIQTTLAAQTAVALQNARSYEQAQTAVAEMNELTRRLTREGWQEYLQKRTSEKTGFMFDAAELDAIQPVADIGESGLDENGSAPAHVQPISIRGEEIGRLVVVPDGTGDVFDEEMMAIINAITEQLGARIDNLRLADQTQTALAETEEQAQRLGRLNQMSNALSQAGNLSNVYTAAVSETSKVIDADRVSLALLTESQEAFNVVAVWGEESQVPVNTKLPVSDESPMWAALQKRQIVPGQIDDMIQSALFVPLYVSGQAIGTLNVGIKEQQEFNDRDENLLRQIAAMVGSTIENLRFLENEQARAQREQVLRQVTQRIRSSADVETIMRTAVQEIGRTLGRRTYIQLDD